MSHYVDACSAAHTNSHTLAAAVDSSNASCCSRYLCTHRQIHGCQPPPTRCTHRHYAPFRSHLVVVATYDSVADVMRKHLHVAHGSFSRELGEGRVIVEAWLRDGHRAHVAEDDCHHRHEHHDQRPRKCVRLGLVAWLGLGRALLRIRAGRTCHACPPCAALRGGHCVGWLPAVRAHATSWC